MSCGLAESLCVRCDAWSSKRTIGSAMANRKQNLQPDGAFARARAPRQSCAFPNVVVLVRFKLTARFTSGRNTVLMSKVSAFT